MVCFEWWWCGLAKPGPDAVRRAPPPSQALASSPAHCEWPERAAAQCTGTPHLDTGQVIDQAAQRTDAKKTSSFLPSAAVHDALAIMSTDSLISQQPTFSCIPGSEPTSTQLPAHHAFFSAPSLSGSCKADACEDQPRGPHSGPSAVAPPATWDPTAYPSLPRLSSQNQQSCDFPIVSEAHPSHKVIVVSHPETADARQDGALLSLLQHSFIVLGDTGSNDLAATQPAPGQGGCGEEQEGSRAAPGCPHAPRTASVEHTLGHQAGGAGSLRCSSASSGAPTQTGVSHIPSSFHSSYAYSGNSGAWQGLPTAAHSQAQGQGQAGQAGPAPGYGWGPGSIPAAPTPTFTRYLSPSTGRSLGYLQMSLPMQALPTMSQPLPHLLPRPPSPPTSATHASTSAPLQPSEHQPATLHPTPQHCTFVCGVVPARSQHRPRTLMRPAMHRGSLSARLHHGSGGAGGGGGGGPASGPGAALLRAAGGGGGGGVWERGGARSPWGLGRAGQGSSSGAGQVLASGQPTLPNSCSRLAVMRLACDLPSPLLPGAQGPAGGALQVAGAVGGQQQALQALAEGGWQPAGEGLSEGYVLGTDPGSGSHSGLMAGDACLENLTAAAAAAGGPSPPGPQASPGVGGGAEPDSRAVGSAAVGGEGELKAWPDQALGGLGPLPPPPKRSPRFVHQHSSDCCHSCSSSGAQASGGGGGVGCSVPLRHSSSLPLQAGHQPGHPAPTMQQQQQQSRCPAPPSTMAWQPAGQGHGQHCSAPLFCFHPDGPISSFGQAQGQPWPLPPVGPHSHSCSMLQLPHGVHGVSLRRGAKSSNLVLISPSSDLMSIQEGEEGSPTSSQQLDGLGAGGQGEGGGAG